ncbi:MAG: hypothetical protein ACXVP0_01250 [Bacteroidia bacterium]
MTTGPQLSIYNRLRFVKIVTASGMLVSMLLSLNLWGGQRWLPTCPVIEGWYVQPPYDYAFIAIEAVLLLMLLFNTPWPRLIMLFVLLLNTVLVLLDQNRLQPWFYLYNTIFLVLLFYNWRIDNSNTYHSFFIILQLCISAVYVFSGLQKLNPNFVNEAYGWFIKPLSGFVSERQMAVLVKTGRIVPYVEMFIGFGLLIKPLRFLAVPLLVITHVSILLLMGPFGNNYNSVVWPWNVAMILLVLLLFSGSTMERYYSITHLFNIPVFYVVMALFWFLPASNLWNYWDTYLSFSLYSGNNHSAKIILSDKAYSRLPYYVRHYVHEEAGLHMLYPKQWCIHELNAPLYPEKRIFNRVTAYVKVLTNGSDDDVKLVYIEKLKLFEERE